MDDFSLDTDAKWNDLQSWIIFSFLWMILLFDRDAKGMNFWNGWFSLWHRWTSPADDFLLDMDTKWMSFSNGWFFCPLNGWNFYFFPLSSSQKKKPFWGRFFCFVTIVQKFAHTNKKNWSSPINMKNYIIVEIGVFPYFKSVQVPYVNKYNFIILISINFNQTNIYYTFF